MARKCTGALHREHMLNVIRRAHGRTGYGMRVNSRYAYSTKHPIIKQLLKRGLIKTTKVVLGSLTSYTHVVPVDNQTLPAWSHLTCPECNDKVVDHRSHAWNCSFRVKWPTGIRQQPKNRRYL